MTDVKIIADSYSSNDCRLTTFLLTYPRIIHSEILTHRAFSRNSASSRAIPIAKAIQSVRDNPFVPEVWVFAHSGMQGNSILNPKQKATCRSEWRNAASTAVHHAEYLKKVGASKQLVNRILEPYSYISVIVTAEHNEFGLYNFFDLRESKFPEGYSWNMFSQEENFLASKSTAQWEIQHLANLMLLELEKSIPIKKEKGDPHIPFFNDFVGNDKSKAEYSARSVVKCARVSYGNHLDELDSIEEVVEKYQALVENKHESPFEHVCCAGNKSGSGNFKEWSQLRHADKTAVINLIIN